MTERIALFAVGASLAAVGWWVHTPPFVIFILVGCVLAFLSIWPECDER